MPGRFPWAVKCFSPEVTPITFAHKFSHSSLLWSRCMAPPSPEGAREENVTMCLESREHKWLPHRMAKKWNSGAIFSGDPNPLRLWFSCTLSGNLLSCQMHVTFKHLKALGSLFYLPLVPEAREVDQEWPMTLFRSTLERPPAVIYVWSLGLGTCPHDCRQPHLCFHGASEHRQQEFSKHFLEVWAAKWTQEQICELSCYLMVMIVILEAPTSGGYCSWALAGNNLSCLLVRKGKSILSHIGVFLFPLSWKGCV